MLLGERFEFSRCRPDFIEHSPCDTQVIYFHWLDQSSGISAAWPTGRIMIVCREVSDNYYLELLAHVVHLIDKQSAGSSC